MPPLAENCRQALEQIFAASLERVDPAACTRNALHYDGKQLCVRTQAGTMALPLPVRVLGAGKAAGRMAAAVEEVVPATHLRGLVVGPAATRARLRRLLFRTASHPVPNWRSVAAARSLIRQARAPFRGSTLFLLSGGASSLVVAPRLPLTLRDKQVVNSLLLRSGASVGEINTVRKHLSLIKGGQLLRIIGGPVTTLTISDVPGDDPTVIGSAPTFYDPTTYQQARAILRRYRLMREVPEAARQILAAGAAGLIPETVKPSDPEANWIHYHILATNQDAQQAALAWARKRGWRATAFPRLLRHESEREANAFARFLRARLKKLRPGSPPAVIVAGGETSVRVRGRGKGGRNQEFALALVPLLRGLPACVLSAGTDGIDGPTDAAGAFVDGSSAARAKQFGLDPTAYLRDNDSYSFFDKLGDLFRPGPTATNVMDLKIAILHPPAS